MSAVSHWTRRTPSSAASIGTLWTVTEVLSLIDQGHATTQAAAESNHRLCGLTLIDLRQNRSNLIGALFIDGAGKTGNARYQHPADRAAGNAGCSAERSRTCRLRPRQRLQSA